MEWEKEIEFNKTQKHPRELAIGLLQLKSLDFDSDSVTMVPTNPVSMNELKGFNNRRIVFGYVVIQNDQIVEERNYWVKIHGFRTENAYITLFFHELNEYTFDENSIYHKENEEEEKEVNVDIE